MEELHLILAPYNSVWWPMLKWNVSCVPYGCTT